MNANGTVVNPCDIVGQLVRQKPSRSRVFERLGIDFCCGGKLSLEAACRNKGIDLETALNMLEADDSRPNADEVDANSMTMAELADHIERAHHDYLRRELPRVEGMIARVVRAHGDRYPWMLKIQSVFTGFRAELESHMMKEERILFPMIRELARAIAPPSFHCGSIANPIRLMEHEHDSAGDDMSEFARLSNGYTPPPDACNTFRAMLDGLREIEIDMHQHVHKENNILFPRAMERENELKSR